MGDGDRLEKVPPPPVAFGIAAVVLSGVLILTVTEVLAAPAAHWALFALWGFLAIVFVTISAAVLLWQYVKRRDFVRAAYSEALRPFGSATGLERARQLRRGLRLTGADAELLALEEARPIRDFAWSLSPHRPTAAPREEQGTQAKLGERQSKRSDFQGRARTYILGLVAPSALAGLLALVPPTVTLVREIKKPGSGGEGNVYPHVEVKPNVAVGPVRPNIMFHPTLAVHPKVSVAEGVDCVRFLVELDELLDDEPHLPRLLPSHSLPLTASARSCGLTEPITEASALAQELSRR